MCIIKRGDLRRKRGTTPAIANWARKTEMDITPCEVLIARAQQHVKRVAMDATRLNTNVIRCRRC